MLWCFHPTFRSCENYGPKPLPMLFPGPLLYGPSPRDSNAPMSTAIPERSKVGSSFCVPWSSLLCLLGSTLHRGSGPLLSSVRLPKTPTAGYREGGDVSIYSVWSISDVSADFEAGLASSFPTLYPKLFLMLAVFPFEVITTLW